MRLTAIILLGLVTAGCGLREPLRPPEGRAMPPAPALSDRAPTTDELLTVSSDMRPLRVDDTLTRSERRPIDPFDLPPPDIPGTSSVEPTDDEAPPPAPANAPQ